MIKIDWNQIPETSGIYIWKGLDNKIIYISKARNLRKKMNEFFCENIKDSRFILLKNIESYEIIEINDEKKVFKLEKTLREEYKPKYNIKIKSAASYPYLELFIKNGESKLKLATKVNVKKRFYFGPMKGINYCKKISQLINFAIDKKYSEKSSFIDFKKMVENFFKNNLIEYKKIFNDFNKIEYLQIINDWEKRNLLVYDDEISRDIFNFYYKDGIISICITFVRLGHTGLRANFFQKIFEPNIQQSLIDFIITYYENHIIPEKIIIPFEYKTWDKSKISFICSEDEITNVLLIDAKNRAKEKYGKNITEFKNNLEKERWIKK